jgi:hypothetical protein
MFILRYGVVKLQIDTICVRRYSLKYTVRSVKMIGDLPVSQRLSKLQLQIGKFFCEILTIHIRYLLQELNNRLTLIRCNLNLLKLLIKYYS